MLRTTSFGRNMKLKPPFFVLSDSHFGHKNIIKYANRPDNHERIMVERWNNTVGDNDVVLHLGDLLFTSNAEKQVRFFEETAPSLNGDKYLILGNHDKKSWKGFYERAGFKVIKPFHMRYRNFLVSFDHYPADVVKGEEEIRVHGHIHTSGYGSVYEKHKTMKKYGNINVSVEMIDYTPKSIEKLLDKAIAEMKPKQQYHNVNKIGAKVRRAA